MLRRLQKKWNVNALQLLLIISTFAIGGSLTGYTGRKLMKFMGITPEWLWIIVFIVLLTLLWPLAVLLVSIPLGQFLFFKKYIRKIGRRFGIGRSKKIAALSRIAIFASGAGSNARKIIERFHQHPSIKVVLIITNNPTAGVLKIANQEGIPHLLLEKEKFFRGSGYLEELRNNRVDWIILAGFLWKIPLSLIRAFPRRILNIHPALLPAHGGKGMYGLFVHEAVIENKEPQSGISIHFVDEIYDHGPIVFQATCPVLPTDTAESLAERIHALEHEHYPVIIEQLVGST